MPVSRERPARAIGRALNPGLLSGISFPFWCALLWQNRFRVSPRYAPRAVSITVASLANSVAGFLEELRYGKEWEQADPGAPVFVIGMARSGTTYLHNLFCTHPGLAYPNRIESHFPRSFLSLGGLAGLLTNRLLGGRRAQDDVTFSSGDPAEEEAALMGLGAPSSLFATAFPRNRERYVRFRLTPGFDPREAQAWIDAIRWFAGKLAWRHRKPLVFKNPGHTGKLALLLAAFPNAKIVFIHRHPCDVLRSRLHSFGKVSPHRRLQSVPLPTAEQDIRRMGRGIRQYLEEREQVPRGNLCEVAYTDLVADPPAVLQSIYETLGLPGFEEGRPALETYLAGLGRYQGNRHAPLPGPVRELLQKECPEWFNEWGYNP